MFQFKHFTCKAFLHAINQYQQKNTLEDDKQSFSNSCSQKIQDHFFLFTNFNYLTYKHHNFNTLAVLLSFKIAYLLHKGFLYILEKLHNNDFKEATSRCIFSTKIIYNQQQQKLRDLIAQSTFLTHEEFINII